MRVLTFITEKQKKKLLFFISFHNSEFHFRVDNNELWKRWSRAGESALKLLFQKVNIIKNFFYCILHAPLSSLWLLILPLLSLAQIFAVLLLHSLPVSGLSNTFSTLNLDDWSIPVRIIVMGLLQLLGLKIRERCHQRYDISSISIQITSDGSKRCFLVKLVRLFLSSTQKRKRSRFVGPCGLLAAETCRTVRMRYKTDKS